MNSTDTALTHRVRQSAADEEHAAPGRRHSLQLQVPDRQSKRILLADDDPGVRQMLGRVLESEHYEVVLAKNGHEAAARFLADPPDLVLLDLNMPDRDGWAAFRVMNVSDPMLPVIVITARPNQYARAVELGVDALMEKPLDLPVLLGAIRRYTNESERERTQRLINPEFKTAFLNERKTTNTSTRHS